MAERQRPMSHVSLLMPAHSTQWSAWSEAGGGIWVVDARDASLTRAARPGRPTSASDGGDRASVHVTVVVGFDCAIAPRVVTAIVYRLCKARRTWVIFQPLNSSNKVQRDC
jgi:hypothetical protein